MPPMRFAQVLQAIYLGVWLLYVHIAAKWRMAGKSDFE